MVLLVPSNPPTIHARLAEYPPDVLLRPDVDSYASLDFRDIDAPIQAGVLEAERQVGALRSLLPELERASS